MDSPDNQSNTLLMWTEISRIESDILKGKLTDENAIRDFLSEMCGFVAARKVSLTWPNKYEDTELGLHIGAIGPWPLVHRIKNLLQKSERLWSSRQQYIYYQACFDCFIKNYHAAQSLLLSNYPKTGLVPVWYFGLTQDTLFKTGQYLKAVELAQRELASRENRLPTYVEENAPTKRFHLLSRCHDRYFQDIIDLDSDYHPGEFLGDNLREYGEYVYELKQLAYHSPKTDLLKKAYFYYEIFSLATASVIYQAYLTRNPKDLEVWFLLGRIHFLLGQDKEARHCLDAIDKDIVFAAWSHFSKGELLFRQEDYSAAEREFHAALKNKAKGLPQTLSRYHLGFIREIQGDFRAALSWYEPEQEGLIPQLAESHLDSLRTRIN